MKDSHLYHDFEDLILKLAILAGASDYSRLTGSRVVLFANRFSGALADPRLLARIRDAAAEHLRRIPEASGHAVPGDTTPGDATSGDAPPGAVVFSPNRREQIPSELLGLAGYLKEALLEGSRGILLLSVGGDGTHKSVLSILLTLSETLRRRVVVFRFPAGSSNDGPSSASPEEAIDRLLIADAEVSLKALEIETRLGGRELGFNIASFGIDAYTTIKNEQFRGVFGGNSYRALANLAVLFYEVAHGPGMLRLEIETDQGEVLVVEESLILIAVGVSGGRTYGGGIAILPDDGNLCFVEHLGLIGKLALKRRLLRGTHLGHPKVHSHKIARLILTAERPIPIQIDGEARWLSPEEGPVVVHLGREHIQELI
ncbi:MAG: diacylglycerol/lipid kinase family protein [Spirochaetaceae bacterium]